MAKAARRKLKVFQTRLGFYDTVVAAPSQAAALRAWGVHQNLFAAGEASLSDDAGAAKAALARPETPLVRAVGSGDAFAPEPTSLPSVPKAPAGSKPKASTSAKRRAAPSRPPVDRTALDDAEAGLRQLEAARKHEEAKLRSRQADLDARREAAQSAYVTQRKAAEDRVRDARAAYRRAGGGG